MAGIVSLGSPDPFSRYATPTNSLSLADLEKKVLGLCSRVIKGSREFALEEIFLFEKEVLEYETQAQGNKTVVKRLEKVREWLYEFRDRLFFAIPLGANQLSIAWLKQSNTFKSEGATCFGCNLENPKVPIFDKICSVGDRESVVIPGSYNRGRDYQFTTAKCEIRLHPVHRRALPSKVRDVLLGFKGKLDLIQRISIGQNIKLINGNDHWNLVTHPWVFPEAENGKTYKKDIELGIFNAIGIQPISNESRGLAVDCLAPTEVHIHPTPDGMAYSPDNAQFRVAPGIPFSSFISVAIDTQEEGIADTRASVVFHTILHQQEDPACRRILEAFKTRTLVDYISRILLPLEGNSPCSKSLFSLFKQQQRALFLPRQMPERRLTVFPQKIVSPTCEIDVLQDSSVSGDVPH